jgi:hypothetical protein
MNVATCRKLRVISYANHPPSVRFFSHTPGRLRGLGSDESTELKRGRSEKQGDDTGFSKTAHGVYLL